MRTYSLLIGTGILFTVIGMMILILFGGGRFHLYPFIFWEDFQLMPFTMFVMMLMISASLILFLICTLGIIPTLETTRWKTRQDTLLDAHTYRGETNTCRECGRQVANDAVFCPYCGSRLED